MHNFNSSERFNDKTNKFQKIHATKLRHNLEQAHERNLQNGSRL